MILFWNQIEPLCDLCQMIKTVNFFECHFVIGTMGVI